MEASGKPNDRFNVVYWIHVLLGVGCLLPWNVFLTETEYFNVRVHQEPYNRGVANNFETTIALLFQAVNLATLIILMRFSTKLTLNQGVLFPFITIGAILALTTGLTQSFGLSGNAMIGITVPCIVILGSTNALINAGLFRLASYFPPIYMQAQTVGFGIAGVGTSLVSLLTLYLSRPQSDVPTPEELAPAAMAYFAAAVAVVAGCIAAYVALFRHPYARQLLSAAGELADRPKGHSSSDAKSEQDLSLLKGQPGSLESASFASPPDEEDPAPLLAATAEAADGIRPRNIGSSGAHGQVEVRDAEKGFGADDGDDGALPVHEGARWSFLQMLAHVGPHCFATAYCFTATLAAFPGVTSAICSMHNGATVAPCLSQSPAGRFFGDLFVPFNFIMFNVGDVAGRSLAGVGRWREKAPSAAAFVVYALARSGITIALLFCHVVTANPWKLTTAFRHDAFPILLTLLLGITNGHLFSLVYMHAPKALPPAARPALGSYMVFSTTLGITLGSVVSLQLVALLQQSS